MQRLADFVALPESRWQVGVASAQEHEIIPHLAEWIIGNIHCFE